MKQPTGPSILKMIKELDPATYYNHFYGREHAMVHDKRKVKLEDLMKHDYIPFGSGRPDREGIIGHDDILNLQIALNTATNITEFLKVV